MYHVVLALGPICPSRRAAYAGARRDICCRHRCAGEGPRVLAETSEDALRDVFGARDGPKSLLDACESNFGAIESVALEQAQSPT
ncbi:hypothetical protein [Variovorax ginsengisoli]|uniref:Uncharacterized protein n=1 Tax=Variovorax ginsengisoli TaxID=363844 RepID=A0ABT8S449_9BURK|nr:hypothetical protein [Variovorax ginsengisoli]MDN8614365.1 hypothetical protein [Variovorax ginsengisoli]MDO1533535.1 hypothetical protein [Variovorax ginsengisoli]